MSGLLEFRFFEWILCTVIHMYIFLFSDLAGVSASDDTSTALVLIDTTGCDMNELNLQHEASKANEGNYYVKVLSKFRELKMTVSCGTTVALFYCLYMSFWQPVFQWCCILDSGYLILTLLTLEIEYSRFGGQYHACWCPESCSHHCISRHGIGCVGQTTCIVITSKSILD